MSQGFQIHQKFKIIDKERIYPVYDIRSIRVFKLWRNRVLIRSSCFVINGNSSLLQCIYSIDRRLLNETLITGKLPNVYSIILQPEAVTLDVPEDLVSFRIVRRTRNYVVTLDNSFLFSTDYHIRRTRMRGRCDINRHL